MIMIVRTSIISGLLAICAMGYPLKLLASTQPNQVSIEDMGLHTVKLGEKFSFTPKLTGNPHLCRKDLGHDDVQVDPQTGKISWDTGLLRFGRGFHIRIRCSNYDSWAFSSMVVHVENNGKSQLKVLGKNGVSKYIAEASEELSSGDTLVIPDGVYPVSVSADGSYENALKMNTPTFGSKSQFTTLIARTPGKAVISGAKSGKIGKQKNAIQLSKSKYIAIVGLVLQDVQRESFTTTGPGHKLLINFVGTKGAGTWGFPCNNFQQAKKGQCSNAGMRVNGGSPLIQASYNWGHNRYGIMTRNTDGSVTRRSFVRLDEHKGDQPYGGFSDYCTKAHLNQDNTVFDSLAIAAPHYKNYAGLAAFPATGCNKTPSEAKVEGLLSVNNKLSLSLMDSKAGPNNIWTNIVSYDSQGTCTPQKNRCGAWLVQSKKVTEISNSYFGKARGFEGDPNLKAAFSRKNIELANDVVIDDVAGMPNRGKAPRYLPELQLYFNGKSDSFWGEPNFSTPTSARRWPIGGEDIMAANMRQYSNPNALKVGGGIIAVEGNRGAVAEKTSMSEYFWGYKDKNIPPLVVRVKKLTDGNIILWENFVGSETRSRVIGWQINCADNGTKNLKILADLDKRILSYRDTSECKSYAVQAKYIDGISGIAYIEK